MYFVINFRFACYTAGFYPLVLLKEFVFYESRTFEKHEETDSLFELFLHCI